ncbi:hypothetical protein BCF59_0400 [Mycoplasmopsis mustelae]|uniref:Lipoprotein n=1 Tax=Mycoplasmopsis mustelae TaxID=171289 RepID=A0A4V3FP00_9BACT|nr:hypothetical protein [Mycoplasmopsis mustelae]TDV24430.1 hypothetical protein BCF59_0400 [Mycoplasmopsis mustelae]
MKIKNKLRALLVFTTSTSPVILTVACSQTQNHQTINTNTKPQNQQIQDQELRQELQTKINSLDNKANFISELNEAKDESELRILKTKIENALVKEIQQQKQFLSDIINTKIQTNSISQKNFLASYLSLRSKTDIKNLKEMIDTYFKNLKQETKTYIDKVKDNAELLEKFKLLDDDFTTISTLKQEAINKFNFEKQTEFKSQKAEVAKKVNQLEENKDIQLQKLNEIQTYDALVSFENEIDKLLQQQQQRKQQQIEAKKQEITLNISLLNSDQKDAFNQKLLNSDTLETLNSLLEAIKSEFSKLTETNQKTNLKSVINVTLSKISSKTIKDKISAKINNQNSVSQLQSFLQEALQELNNEISKALTSANASLKILNVQEPNNNYDFTNQLSVASSAAEIKSIQDKIIKQIRTKKPLMFVEEKDWKRTSPYLTTLVEANAPRELANDAKRVSVTWGRKTGFIYSTPTNLVRTFTLTEVDKQLQNKFIELKKQVLDEFYTLSNVNGLKVYTFTEHIQNSRILQIGISQLLFSIDRVLRDGYFYQEIYDKYLGNVDDGIGITTKPPVIQSFNNLKNKSQALKNSANI